MKRIKHSILILLTLLSISKAVGQNYPVQSFVQISQPYSSYLPDYADPFNNQLKILLTLTDFTVPSHQVKIKIHLNGNGYSIETKDNLNLPPIILTPGAPVEISGSDLAPYLATENLNFSGIDVNNYLQTKVLPEGPCQICVDIIDFTSPSGTLLGNPACAQAWFERLQPPFANTPFCGDTISTNNPQVVLFNWTPVTSNSPSTFTTEYVFELYENTAGIEIDPNVLVTTTLPVSIITTPNAFINFGMTDYQLQVGKQYVWRVQARNTEGRDLYVNNGYSAVCSFVYGSLIESLTNGIELELQTNGTGTRQGNAIWNANSVFDNYVLEVRKTGNSDFEWFPYTTEFGVPISNMKINGLEPETEYEARIKGLIGNEFESDYSNVSVFTTNPTPNYQCGSEAMPATSPNITPLQVATYGMFFTIGQFEMMVTHIEPLVGQAGHYKGLGQITMPFLLTKLNVSYQDILVDDNLMVREGKVEAITQGIDAWEHDQLIDLATPHYTPEVDTSLITMAVDSSGILVTFTGVDSTFEFEGNGIPIVLNAEGGIQYIIWPDGSIELGTWGNVSTEDFDATKDYYVNFEAAPNQAYGFDDYNSDFSAWAGNYENIFLSDNTNYYVSYKSTAWNIGDHVLAKLHTDSTALDLTFTIDGDELDANHVNKINDSTYNLNLDGYMETYSENVYAFDSYGRKIGKLRVIPYENKNIQVYIVPVGSAQINQPNLETELNNIYKVANTHFDVTIEPTFNNTAWDLNNDGKIEVTDPQLLAAYSDEMRKLRQQYFDSSNVERDKEALYIFVVDQFDDPNQDGYMVKGKSFGFVKNNPSVKTIAHEIGHGAFKLEHTFPTITQNTTNNLLDYSSGTELLKPQWEQIFNTQITFSFLDDEEDGGSFSNILLPKSCTINENDEFIGYLTPNLDRIILPKNYIPMFKHGIPNDDETHILTGSLVGFYTEYIIGDNLEFHSVSTSKWIAKYSGTTFLGYFNTSDEKYDYVKPNNITDDNSYVVFTPSTEGQESGFDINAASLYLFKPNFTLTDYSNSNEQISEITSDKLKNLKMFTPDNPTFRKYLNIPLQQNFNDQLAITYSEMLFLDGGQANSLGTGIFSNNQSHSGKREMFLILKIAELNNRFPEYVENFDCLSCNFNLYEDNKSLHNSILYNFYVDYLAELLQYINTSIVNTDNCISNAEQIYDNGTVSDFDWENDTPENILNNLIDKIENIDTDYVEQFNTCLAGLSQDQIANFSRSSIIKYLTIILKNDNDEISMLQVSRLLKWSDYENFTTFVYTYLLSKNKTTKLENLTAVIDTKFFKYLNITQIEKVIDIVIDDEDSWYKIAGMIHEVRQNFSSEDQLTILSKFSTNDWFKKLNDLQNEWFDFSDMEEFNPFGQIFNELFQIYFDNLTIIQNGFQANPELSQNNFSNSFNVPVPYNQFPILLGNKESSTLNIGDVNGDGKTIGNFDVSNQNTIPFDYVDGFFNVNQNFSYSENVKEGLENYNYPIYNFNESYKIHPFELVEVIIVENDNNVGLSKYDVLQVPAFYLVLLKQAYENSKFKLDMEFYEPIIELAGVALVVAGTYFTGGAMAAVYSEILVGGGLVLFQCADFVIKTEQNSSDNPNSSFYTTWNQVDKVITIYESVYFMAELPKIINGLYHLGKLTFKLSKGLIINSIKHLIFLRPKIKLLRKINKLSGNFSALQNWVIGLKNLEDMEFITKLKNLSQTDLEKFANDFNTTEKLNTLKSNIEILNDWLELAEAGGELVRGVSKSVFKASFTASDEIAEQAWTLFKNEDWPALENLFNTNNLNKRDGVIYPPNNGAINIIKKTLDPSDFDGALIIDRYGTTTGKFTSPVNTPFPERALPASYGSQTPQKYEVVNPIPNVEEGQIIPWFGQEGLGTQYKFEKPVQYYIDEGYIIPIP